LAAAYAEKGDFTNAVTTAETVRQLAVASGQPELVAAAVKRLDLYKSGQPLRDP
jgi:hypothetical protein